MLREDNADLRLTEIGRRLGLVDDARWAAFDRKREAIAREQERLKSTWVGPRNLSAEDAQRVLGKPIEREYTLLDLLKRPDVSYDSLMSIPLSGRAVDDYFVSEQVEIQAKYAGYITRQQDEVSRGESQESLCLPADLDYRSVRGLSYEVQQRLNQHKPETLGQASRLSGITPAAISLLMVHLKRSSRAAKGDASNTGRDDQQGQPGRQTAA